MATQFSQGATDWLAGRSQATPKTPTNNGFSQSANQWLTQAPAKKVVQPAPQTKASVSVPQPHTLGQQIMNNETPAQKFLSPLWMKYIENPIRNAPEAHFADKEIQLFKPVGFGKVANQAVNFGAGLAQGTINTPKEAALGAMSVGQHLKQGTSTPQQVTADLAAAAQLPLLFFGGEGALTDVAGSIFGKQGLKAAGKAVAKQTGIGAAFGALGGVQSGKNINNTSDYIKNFLTNVGIGAATGGAFSGLTHVVVPLAKGLGSHLGAVFIKDVNKEPKVTKIHLDPQVARNTVMGSGMEDTPAGKAILKDSVRAQQTESHVAIIPDESGKYSLHNGQKINVDVAPVYDPSTAKRSVPSSIINQSGTHEVVPMDKIVSLKEEGQTSLKRAGEFIQQAESGKGQPREPIKVMKMKDGKYFVIDGNATYQTLKAQGYTHIPVQMEDTAKLHGLNITDEQLKTAATEHFAADKNKRTYGKLFNELAHKFGGEKVGHPEKSNVKSIVGILEKKHGRQSEVRDVLRDTIIIKHPEDAAKIVEELRSRGFTGEKFNSERRNNGFKNRYLDKEIGYKDANYQFTDKNGQTVELQLMQKEMQKEKHLLGHPVYDMVDKAGKVVKDLTPEQKQALQMWKDYADKRYHAAFLRDNPDLAKVTSDVTKSAETGTPEVSPEFTKSLKEQLNTLRQAESANLSSSAEKVDKAFNSVMGESSKTSVTKSDNASNRQYVYHGTKSKYLDDVVKNGLDPKNQKNGEFTFFHKIEDRTHEFFKGEDGIIFRIKRSDLPKDALNSDIGSNVLETKTKIPPEVLEVKQNGEWRPLKPEQKQSGFTGVSQPVGTGKLKESRAYQRLVENLKAEGNLEALQNMPSSSEVKYHIANYDKQAEGALKVIEEDPNKAYRIAKGYEEPPEGMLQRPFQVGLADRAVEEKNWKLAADIEPTGSFNQTRRGQEVGYDRGRFDDNSFHKFAQQLLDTRLKRLGRSVVTDIVDMSPKLQKFASSAKAKAVAKIDQTVEKAMKFTAKERKRIVSAQNLLDQLTCK